MCTAGITRAQVRTTSARVDATHYRAFRLTVEFDGSHSSTSGGGSVRTPSTATNRRQEGFSRSFGAVAIADADQIFVAAVRIGGIDDDR